MDDWLGVRGGRVWGSVEIEGSATVFGSGVETNDSREEDTKTYWLSHRPDLPLPKHHS